MFGIICSGFLCFSLLTVLGACPSALAAPGVVLPPLPEEEMSKDDVKKDDAANKGGAPSNSDSKAGADSVKLLDEGTLRSLLRDMHEILRRMKSATSDLRHEANRRQMVTQNPIDSDYYYMDPWCAENPGLAPFVMNSTTTATGPYLTCRPEYLNTALTELSTLISQGKEKTALFKQELGELGPQDKKLAEKLKEGDDYFQSFDDKLISLQVLCKPPVGNKTLNDTAAQLEILVNDYDRVCQEEWKLAGEFLKRQSKNR